jgi:hypothetical protein
MANRPGNGGSGHEAGGGSDDNKKIDDIVAGAVGLSAQVLSENLRQAQDAADRYRDDHYTWDDADQDMRQLGMRMADAAGRMTGYWFDMARAILLRPNRRPANESKPPGQGEAKPARQERASGPHRGRTNGNVTSNRTINGRLEFRDDLPASAELEVTHGLRSRSSSVPPLTDIRFTRSDNGETITAAVDVPDDQVAGVYSGIVWDKTPSEPVPVGALSVDVLA